MMLSAEFDRQNLLFLMILAMALLQLNWCLNCFAIHIMCRHDKLTLPGISSVSNVIDDKLRRWRFDLHNYEAF